MSKENGYSDRLDEIHTMLQNSRGMPTAEKIRRINAAKAVGAAFLSGLNPFAGNLHNDEQDYVSRLKYRDKSIPLEIRYIVILDNEVDAIEKGTGIELFEGALLMLQERK